MTRIYGATGITSTTETQPILQKLREQREKNVSSLSNSKDRAQLTATTAMSILHISILKSLIDKGPDEIRYYTVSLVLIICSLVLQITAGALTLFVTNMTSYYAKHRQNLCRDFKALIPCLSSGGGDDASKPTNDTKGKRYNARNAKDSTSNTSNNPDLPEMSFNPVAYWNNQMAKKYRDGFNTMAVDMLEEWRPGHLITELKASEAKYQMEDQIAMVNELSETDEPSMLEEDGLSDRTPTNLTQDKTKEIVSKNEYISKKRNYEALDRQFKLSQAWGLILTAEVEEVLQSEVVIIVSFWQHIINYIYFVVVVLNTFIFGFGLVKQTTPSVTTNNTT